MNHYKQQKIIEYLISDLAFQTRKKIFTLKVTSKKSSIETNKLMNRSAKIKRQLISENSGLTKTSAD